VTLQAYLTKCRVRLSDIVTSSWEGTVIELSDAKVGTFAIIDGALLHSEVGLREEASVVGNDGLEGSNGVRPRLTRSYIPRILIGARSTSNWSGQSIPRCRPNLSSNLRC
jgi:hypothetical protein